MARFLVVDDDSAAVSGLTVLLRADGHGVAGFTSSVEAFEALEADAFDVVLTDLEMPKVDGFAIVEKARKVIPNACVVVVSARARDKRELLEQAGASLVVEKPIDFDAMMRDIAACRSNGANGASEGG